MLSSEVIAADIDAIFADQGKPATWNGQDVTVIARGRTLLTQGNMRKWTGSFTVRVSDVPEPEPGDVIVFDGAEWTVGDPSGEPVTGGEYLWAVQAVKQRRPTFNG